jgi:Bacterial pre-peptidase C-terminal domain
MAFPATLVGGVVVDPEPALQNGVPKTNQSGAAKSWNYYPIDVPAGAVSLKFNISGSNGDADLFTQLTSKPTTSAYKCKSDGSTSVETCSLTSPQAGRYYLGVYAYSAYSGLSVTATYSLSK